MQFLHILFPAITFGGVLVGSAVSAIGNWHDLGIFSALTLFFSLALLSSAAADNRLWRFLCIGVAVASIVLLIIVNFGDVWLGLGGLALFFAAYVWGASRAEGAPVSLRPVPHRPLVARAWSTHGRYVLGRIFHPQCASGALCA